MALKRVHLQSSSSSSNLLELVRYTVKVKKNWDDPWKNIPYLRPVTGNQVARGIPSVSFSFDYGLIQRSDKHDYNQYTALSFLDYYVMIEVTGREQSGGVSLSKNIPLWVGTFPREGSRIKQSQDGEGQGVQNITAVGLEHQLDRVTVRGSFCKESAEFAVDETLTFNYRAGFGMTLRGNRSTAVGTDGVHLFSSDGEEWNHRQALEYIFEKHLPEDGPSFSLEGEVERLDGLHNVVYVEGFSVRQVLDKFIPRNRGLGWTLRSNGTGVVEVVVFSAFGSNYSAPGVSISRSANRIGINLDNFPGRIGALHTKNSTDQYEKIIAQGDYINSACTLSFLDGNFEMAWQKDPEENTYIAANDIDRETDRHDRVYRLFRVPPGWDQTAGDGLGGNKSTVTPSCRPDGTLDPDNPAEIFLQNKGFLPELPFFKDTEKPGADPEYMEPFGLIEDEKLDSLDHEARLVMMDREDYPAQIRMMDRELAIYVYAGMNHLYGLKHFNHLDSPTSKVAPRHNYETGLFTVNLQTSQKLRYETDITTGPKTEMPRVLTIDVPDAQCWYVTPGTVYKTKKKKANGESYLLRHKGGTVRNDVQYLKEVANYAKAWYSQKRSTISLSVGCITFANAVGTFLKWVKTGDQELEVNTVITGVTWNFENRITTIQTGYSELDAKASAGKLTVDFPGLSDPRAVARQVHKIKADMNKLQVKTGRMPSRIPTQSKDIICDDKHKNEVNANRSSVVRRMTTKEDADFDDLLWPRKIPGDEMRLMLRLNDSFFGSSGEGGWDVIPGDPPHQEYYPPDMDPVPGWTGRRGDRICLPEALLIEITKDGDSYVKECDRHDIMIYRSAAEVGRERYTSDKGNLESGYPLWGVMGPDAAIANTDTKHAPYETIQWRPLIWMPLYTANPWTATPWTDPPPTGPTDGFTIPRQVSRGNTQVGLFASDENNAASAEDFWWDTPLIDPGVVPLGFSMMMVSPDAGEISIAMDAVFRYTFYVYRDGSTINSPSAEYHGQVITPIEVTDDGNFVTSIGSMGFDRREFQAGDMLVWVLYRDRSDPRDTAGSVYCKGARPLIEPPSEAGAVFNFFVEDEAKSVIAYPVLA